MAKGKVKFQRRHFELIAQVVREYEEDRVHSVFPPDLADYFAQYLKDTNPQFDPQRFKEACRQ